MSKIKRFYENVTDAVTDAMYQECMGMEDVIYSDSDPSEMPLTAKAISILEPIITEYVDRRTA